MDDTMIGRRQLIAGAGLAGAGAIGAVSLLRPQAALAAEGEDRGIVGGWLATVHDLDDNSTIHAAIAFSPGGGFAETDDGGGIHPPGTGVGAWVATGEHHYRFEFLSFVNDPQVGTITVTVKARLQYHPESDTWTGTSTVTGVASTGQVLFSGGKGQTVRATRIRP